MTLPAPKTVTKRGEKAPPKPHAPRREKVHAGRREKAHAVPAAPLPVLAVASEMFPLIKTGGLADVTGALPGALAVEGVAPRTLIPGYPAVLAALTGATPVLILPALSGGPARVLAGRAAGLDLLVLDAPHLYDRPGNPYLGPDGRDWPDNPRRFAALAQVAADIGLGLLEGYRPQVIHAHDWQAGLVPAYLRYARDAAHGTERGTGPGTGRGTRRAHRAGAAPGTIMTVHNLAFQGNVAASLLPVLDLPERAMSVEGVEFHGQISFLKAGLNYADRITTVSPTYAVEILGPEAGMGFDGILRARAGVLSGILNGIDTTVWNPATDPMLAAWYGGPTPEEHAINKAALLARFGLPGDLDAPLFGVVSRLTGQKGIDILLDCLPVLRSLGARLVVLGTGEPRFEAAFRALAPDFAGCVIGYDETLAHRLQAGVDALLVPSRFEPCGLTQLCALRYGAIPVVSRVGGLADTVIDANPAALVAGVATGVQFSPVTAEALAAALRHTVALYRDPITWSVLRRNAMAADVSWARPARAYAALYRAVAA